MKKGIFINMCIITTQSIFRIPDSIEVLSFIRMIPIIAYVLVIINAKHIFISRESRIETKKRVYLYGLIIISYILIIASICAGYFEQDVMKFCLDNAFLTFYLSLIGVYLNAIFKAAKKE